MGAAGAAHVGIRQCSHPHTWPSEAVPRKHPERLTRLVGQAIWLRHNTQARTSIMASGAQAMARQSAAASDTSSAQRQLDQQPDAQPLHREPSAAVPALKEWAVTCAALGAGQQTVSFA